MELPPIPIDGVIAFPLKLKEPSGKALRVAQTSYNDCRHLHTEVDIKKSELTCLDCKEKLNPIWFLEQLSREDDRLFRRWAELKVRIEAMSSKTKCKCIHCGKMTPIPSNLSDSKMMEKAHFMKERP